MARIKRRDPWVLSSGAQRLIEAGASYEKREPARTGDLRGDLLLPLLQSIVTSVAVGIAAFVIFRDTELALAAAGVSGALSWIVLLRAHRDLLWTIEVITGRDWDGDDIVGEPEPPEPAQQMRVEVVEHRQGGRGSIHYADLPLDAEKLKLVAQHILVGRGTFSRPSLCGESRILTQTEFNRLAAAMESAGLLVKMPGNRRELSGPGRSLMRRLIE